MAKKIFVKQEMEMKHIVFACILLASCSIGRNAHEPELTTDQICEAFRADSVKAGELKSFDVWVGGDTYCVLKAGSAGYRVWQETFDIRFGSHNAPTKTAKEYEIKINKLIKR